jgi:hypothetical protein
MSLENTESEKSYYVISQLEGPLKACIRLQLQENSIWLMTVKLFYDGESVGSISFNLQGYTESEAEDVARNIKSNAMLMREIDEFLWGESD